MKKILFPFLLLISACAIPMESEPISEVEDEWSSWFPLPMNISFPNTRWSCFAGDVHGILPKVEVWADDFDSAGGKAFGTWASFNNTYAYPETIACVGANDDKNWSTWVCRGKDTFGYTLVDSAWGIDELSAQDWIENYWLRKGESVSTNPITCSSSIFEENEVIIPTNLDGQEPFDCSENLRTGGITHHTIVYAVPYSVGPLSAYQTYSRWHLSTFGYGPYHPNVELVICRKASY